MLVFEPDGLYAGWVNVWGDWAAHIAYSTSLASQKFFPPQFPILSNHVLSYPFAANFISAILIRLGIPLTGAMLIPSFFLSVTTVIALFWFFKQILASSKAATLAVFLFLFNGGLGFLWFRRSPQEYTHIEGGPNIEWINIITSELIPQRGFLLGLPIALFILSLLWQRYKNPKKIASWKMLIAGIATGLLPVIHMHSFLIIIAFSLWTYFLVLAKRHRTADFAWYFLPAISIAAILIRTFFPQFGASFIKFRPGWLADQAGDNIFVFWLKNAGVTLVLSSLFLFWLLFRGDPKRKKLLVWTLPFWGLFIAGNLFTFQPYDWDNTKFFTFWWLAAAGLAAIPINRLLSGRLWFRLAALILFYLAILSGSLDVFRLTQYENLKLRMLSKEDMKLATWAKEQTPVESVFLTADNHDNPVAMLSGRRIVLGYPGWLWTYGIDTNERRIKTENVYAGQNATSLITELEIDYVLIGPREQGRYQELDESFFEKNFPVVYEERGVRIFKTDFLPTDELRPNRLPLE